VNSVTRCCAVVRQRLLITAFPPLCPSPRDVSYPAHLPRQQSGAASGIGSCIPRDHGRTITRPAPPVHWPGGCPLHDTSSRDPALPSRLGAVFSGNRPCGRRFSGSIEAARAAVYDAREAVAPGIDLLRWRGNGPKFSDFSLHRTPVRLEIGKPCARSAAMRAPITPVRQTPSACPKTGGKIPASGDAVPPSQGMPHTQPCLTGGSAGYRREPVFNRQLPGEKPG
jgi:hypothetical protein